MVWAQQHPTGLLLVEEKDDLKQMEDVSVGILSGVLTSILLGYVLVIGLSGERIEWMRGDGFKTLVYWLCILTCVTIGQLVFTYYIVSKWSQTPKQIDPSVPQVV